MNAQGSSYLRFDEDAHVRLRERGTQSEGGTWDTMALADGEHAVEVKFRPPSQEEETDNLLIEMDFFHLPNEDDSRAFHMCVEYPLSRSQVEVLRRYLDFALHMWGEEAAP
jgi:hypothetical protein